MAWQLGLVHVRQKISKQGRFPFQEAIEVLVRFRVGGQHGFDFLSEAEIIPTGLIQIGDPVFALQIACFQIDVGESLVSCAAVHGGDSEEESSSTIMAGNHRGSRQVLQYEAPGFVSLKVRMIRARSHRACRSAPTMKCPKVVKIRSLRRPSMAFTMMRAA